MEEVREEIQKLFAVQEIQDKYAYIEKIEKFFKKMLSDKNQEYYIEDVIKDAMWAYADSLEGFLQDNMEGENKKSIIKQIISQMNIVINVIANYNIKPAKKDFIDFLLKCADLYMSASPSNSEIMLSDAMDLLRQFSDNNQLSDEQKEKFGQIIQKIQSKIVRNFDELDNIFNEFIEKHIPFSEKNRTGFLNYIIKLRNFEGILPEKYCDYFLVEALANLPALGERLKDPKNLFHLVLKRAFEDKSRYVLKAKGIEKHIVRLFPINGVSARYLAPSKQLVYGTKFSEFSINDINSLFHEPQHAYQCDKKEKGIIDSYTLYRIRKEDVIKDENPEEFYTDNYTYMYEEIDARSAGEEGVMEFIWKIYDLLEVRQDYKQQGQAIHEDYIRKQEADMETGKTKRNFMGKMMDVDRMFENIIARKTEILQQYPEFSIEFNKDGSKKNAITLLEEHEALWQSDPNGDSKEYIYDELFKSGKIPFYLQDIEQFLQSDVQSKKGKEYRKLIVGNLVNPSIRNLYEQAYSVVFPTYMVIDREKAQQFDELSGILQKFCTENPEDDISVIISNGIFPMVDEIQNATYMGVISDTTEADKEKIKLGQIFRGLSNIDIQQGYNVIKGVLSNAKGKIGDITKKIWNEGR